MSIITRILYVLMYLMVRALVTGVATLAAFALFRIPTPPVSFVHLALATMTLDLFYMALRGAGIGFMKAVREQAAKAEIVALSKKLEAERRTLASREEVDALSPTAKALVAQYLYKEAREAATHD